MAAQLFSDGKGCPTSAERVEHRVAIIRASLNDPTEQLLRHLATVPAAALREGASDPREKPSVAMLREPIGNVLRPKNKSILRRHLCRQDRRHHPGVVRQAPFGMGSFITVN